MKSSALPLSETCPPYWRGEIQRGCGKITPPPTPSSERRGATN